MKRFFVLLVALFASLNLNAAADDAFLLGYCRALLDTVLEQPDVHVSVTEGVVQLHNAPVNEATRAAIVAMLRDVDGVERVEFASETDDSPDSLREDSHESSGEWFPEDDLFESLVADPMESRFVVSYRYSDLFNSNIGMAGFGEVLGLYRWQVGEGHRIQLGVEGSSFSYFNLDDEGDIIGSDFHVGLPVTWAYEDFSSRFRFMHRSGHYGDEYLFSNPGIVTAGGEDTNVSDHYIDWLLAYGPDDWRVYGGFEYIWDPEPDRDATSLLLGGEYIPWSDQSIHPVFGVHLEIIEEFGWHVSQRYVAGVEFEDFPFRNRNVKLLGEYYNGKALEMPFFREDGDFFGISIYLDL